MAGELLPSGARGWGERRQRIGRGARLVMLGENDLIWGRESEIFQFFID